MSLGEAARAQALQPAVELENWHTTFKESKLCLSRSTQKTILMPGLGWAVRSHNTFCGAAWMQKHNGLQDTYVSVTVGDLVVPTAWDFDGATWFAQRDEGGWTYANVLHGEDNAEGWLPCEVVDRALREGFDITYAQLYLGWNDTPIPPLCESVEPLPPYRKCHATLGYLPALPDRLMNWAMERGDRLIKKFWHDGYLPFYSSKPEVTNNGVVHNSTCHYTVSCVSRRRTGSYNCFRSMLDGEVVQPAMLSELPAMFSEFLLAPGLPLIGSLDERSHVFDLCRHLSHFLDCEVYSQPALNTPFLTSENSRWVQPHITLSPPLVVGAPRGYEGTCALPSDEELRAMPPPPFPPPFAPSPSGKPPRMPNARGFQPPLQ